MLIKKSGSWYEATNQITISSQQVNYLIQQLRALQCTSGREFFALKMEASIVNDKQFGLSFGRNHIASYRIVLC